MGKDERHYNINKLNVLFAIASVLLLFSIFFMFFQDYDREWKDYQRQFRSMEVEKARIKLDKVEIELSEQDEYKQLVTDLEKAQQDYDKNCASQTTLQTEIKELESQLILVEQNYKFRKAEMDAAKYRFEHAEAEHLPHVAEYKKEYLALDQRTIDLNLEVEKATTAAKQKRIVLEQCGEQLKQLERQKIKVAGKKDLLERKLEKIDPAQMKFSNQIADLVRDLPIIDLANPNNKIEQVVLSDLTDSVNFMDVPKVERCITCHLGISNPDYVNEIQPFRTHPNLELYVGKDSPHAIEEFGCTVCHGGRARGTSFNGAVHVPSSPEQKKAWEKKYNYHQIELWEDPMLPLPYVEAGCFKCHSGEFPIKGAEKLNLGLNLIEKAGCYACHAIERYADWDKPGPDLTKLDNKVTKEWAYRWINDPHSFRHNTLMPAFFNQSNNSDPVSKKRSEQEIHAIVHYLFDNSAPFETQKIPFTGDEKNGELLVSSIGCFACHQVMPEPSLDKSTVDSVRRRYGPNLIGLGSKTSAVWLYNWLKDPNRYHPQTSMPNLRLTDQEAADITSYLIQNKNSHFEQSVIPAIDANILNDIVLGFLKRSDTDQEARNKMAKMKLEQKLQFAGEKLIGQYGCYSCHNIKGFDNVKPIGVELTEESSKSIHKFDFGFVHMEHSKNAWYTQKLKDPRIFDKGKIKAPDEKLKMPNFHFKDEEVDAIVTALMGFVNDKSVESKKMPRTPEMLLKEQGQEIVAQFNCMGCHIIEKEGGTIAATVETWLKDYEGKTENEAAKVRDSFSPPNLYGVGIKLNSEWLFNFLHEPKQQIRPWLRVRMPTFNFNVSHLNALVQYFQTVDGEKFPFKMDVDTSITTEEYAAAEKLFSVDYFGCTQCHVVGTKLPSGSQDSWAPDLSLAKTRLQPEWMIEWIKNPPSLVPGTKMPTFFDPQNFEESGPADVLNGDENEQIRVLRNFLMNMSDKTQTVPVSPATK